MTTPQGADEVQPNAAQGPTWDPMRLENPSLQPEEPPLQLPPKKKPDVAKIILLALVVIISIILATALVFFGDDQTRRCGLHQLEWMMMP